MTSESMYQHDVFIACNRNSAHDKYLAERLCKELKKFKIPKGFRRKPDNKFLNVYLDASNDDIGSRLQTDSVSALTNSRFLIIIASPRTPDSRDVIEKIQFFKEQGRQNAILPVLIEGEPDISFPPQLRVMVRPLTDNGSQTGHDLADAYNSISIAAIYSNDPKSAVAYCRKALDIYQGRKNGSIVYINLAIAYLFDGQFENAMQIMDQKGGIAIDELIITAFNPLKYSLNSTVKDDIKAALEQLKKNNVWCLNAEKVLDKLK